jgi:hypothetical protein
MKDLSDYILFLVEDCELPLSVKLTKEGSYVVTVTNDLKFSTVLYKIAFEGEQTRYVRNQIKKYLSHLDIIVNVEFINYPAKFNPIKKTYEYKLS